MQKNKKIFIGAMVSGILSASILTAVHAESEADSSAQGQATSEHRCNGTTCSSSSGCGSKNASEESKNKTEESKEKSKSEKKSQHNKKNKEKNQESAPNSTAPNSQSSTGVSQNSD